MKTLFIKGFFKNFFDRISSNQTLLTSYFLKRPKDGAKLVSNDFLQNFLVVFEDKRFLY